MIEQWQAVVRRTLESTVMQLLAWALHRGLSRRARTNNNASNDKSKTDCLLVVCSAGRKGGRRCKRRSSDPGVRIERADGE